MAHGQTDIDAGRATAYARFYNAIEQASANGEAVLHEAAVVANPLQVLVRRFPHHYPPERKIMELSGKDGSPLAVSAGVNVVIESSAGNGPAAAKLTPFYDERESRPWFGRDDLSTDAQGYIFDTNGQLVGVVRDPPAERPQVAAAQP
jgi:hypothetical protein